MATTPKKRRRWIVPVSIVVALLLVAGVVFAVTKQKSKPSPTAGYDTLTVQTSEQTQTVTLSGTIKPQNQSNATFKVPGTITEVDAKVGDKVTKGTVIAKVDDRDLADAQALAEAQASAAEAQLKTVQDTEGVTDAQLAAAKAQVNSANASLEQAKNRRGDASLVAPIDGTIAKIDYAVGDQVSGSSASSSGSLSGLSGMSGSSGMSGAAAQAAAAAAAAGLGSSGAGSSASASGIVILATDAWQLDASVGTADLPSIKAGETAVITPTGTSTQVRGVVDTVGIVATQNAGASATFPVTIKVTDAGVPLFSGSSADALVTVAQAPDVLAVPISAVTTSSNGTSTVRMDVTAMPKQVTLGRHFGSNVEVTQGLAAGDKILVPKAQAVARPTQPLYGPNGQYASPTATPTK